MTYEFAGCLIATKDQLLAAIAHQYMTDNGMTAAEDARRDSANENASTLADDCIECFGLNDEWLKERDIDRDMIAKAIAQFISA